MNRLSLRILTPRIIIGLVSVSMVWTATVAAVILCATHAVPIWPIMIACVVITGLVLASIAQDARHRATIAKLEGDVREAALYRRTSVRHLIKHWLKGAPDEGVLCEQGATLHVIYVPPFISHVCYFGCLRAPLRATDASREWMIDDRPICKMSLTITVSPNSTMPGAMAIIDAPVEGGLQANTLPWPYGRKAIRLPNGAHLFFFGSLFEGAALYEELMAADCDADALRRAFARIDVANDPDLNEFS